MNNGIEIPGRVNINPRVIDGPTAMPAHVVLQDGTRYNVFVLGGLSKLEWATVTVAGRVVLDMDDPAANVEWCSKRAKALLDAAQAMERGSCEDRVSEVK